MERTDNYRSPAGPGRRIYPRDLIHNFPPVQEGKTIRDPDVFAFAVSLPGSSHIRRGIPCQDYSEIRKVKNRGIFLGGIADGVGSCPLSHWGAYIAVTEALDYVESQLRIEEEGLTDEEIGKILNEAFSQARRRVEEAADHGGQAAYNLQSTLTVAVYDGRSLYCCHAGDDGVVAQTQEGIVKMATNRQKGEEANSVYPLQTGKWEITKMKDRVVGFLMATDGVLDAFAFPCPATDKINYFNHIYYPFMEPALYGMMERESLDPVKRTLDYYKKYFSSDGYRKKVTDDLTLVAVIAPERLEISRRPDFDKNRWNAIEEERERKKAEALGYRRREEACTGENKEAFVKSPAVQEKKKKGGHGSGKKGKKNKKGRKLLWIGIALVVIAAVGAGGIAGYYIGQKWLPSAREEQREDAEEENRNQPERNFRSSTPIEAFYDKP